MNTSHCHQGPVVYRDIVNCAMHHEHQSLTPEASSAYCTTNVFWIVTVQPVLLHIFIQYYVIIILKNILNLIFEG